MLVNKWVPVCYAVRGLALFGVITIALVLWGCANQQVDPRELGAIASKGTAETLYQAIYLAHKTGKVSEQDMALADVAYTLGQEMQRRYLTALEAGDPDAETFATAANVSKDNLRLLYEQSASR